MPDTIFEISQWIEAPAEIVFDYFVDPAKIVQWLGIEARVDAVEGGEWLILFPGGIETWGRFLTLSAPTRLVFTWGSRALDGSLEPGKPGLTVLGDSVVEVTLTERGKRTLLELKHTGFAEGEPAAIGWTTFVGQLAAVAGRR